MRTMQQRRFEAVDDAMDQVSQALAKLVFAGPMPRLQDAEAVEAASKMLTEVMDLLRPVRTRLSDQAIIAWESLREEL